MNSEEIKSAINNTLDMCEDHDFATSEVIEYYKSEFQYGNENVFMPIIEQFRNSEISRDEAYELLIN